MGEIKISGFIEQHLERQDHPSGLERRMADGRDRYMFWSGRVPSERPLELSEEREREGKKAGGETDGGRRRQWKRQTIAGRRPCKMMGTRATEDSGLVPWPDSVRKKTEGRGRGNTHTQTHSCHIAVPIDTRGGCPEREVERREGTRRDSNRPGQIKGGRGRRH